MAELLVEEQAQREACEEGANNARRLCVVIDGFIPQAECDLLASQLNPLLCSTKSPSLYNLVLNYSGAHDDHGADQKTVDLLMSISHRLWERLNSLDAADEAGRALLQE